MAGRSLLRAGRASLRLWVRDVPSPGAGLLRDAERAYDRLVPLVPWPERAALRVHLAFSVLPGASLYAALRERGVDRTSGVRTVSDSLAAMALPRRRLLKLVTRYEAGRAAFLRAAPRVTTTAFPEPGWHADWVERSPDRVAFDMTRCFDLDMLRELGMAELAPALCAVDDVLYADLCPELRWCRTGTLANGDPACDFRFERVEGATASEPALTPSPVSGRVCPWWFTPSFDNPLRHRVHPPDELLWAYVHPGDRVLDLGPGIGYFTVTLARLVGEGGQVVAADVQPRMLAGTRARVARAGLGPRLHTHLSSVDTLGLPTDLRLDFVLAFWMLHEVRDPARLLAEVRSALAPGGTVLLVEPVGHVTRSRFAAELRTAVAQGFRVAPGPRVRLSRSAVLTAPGQVTRLTSVTAHVVAPRV